MRNIHPIQTYFHDNSLKTRTICNFCEASYPIDANLTNLKNHFYKCHTNEYYLAMNEYEKNKKEIQKNNMNQINNTFPEKNKDNELNIIKNHKHVQIRDKTDYEVEEIIETNNVPIKQNKRTNNEIQNNKIIKKQKIEEDIINHIDNIELTKESHIKIVKDTILISGKCKIIFK
ncbi:3749_t:CDS:1 [Cetraspora pellucida]|uniref:3749_t:CDS:1 n=1 Tax=Cetraspora pellucida TaxID=1433469 RepID=A0A9N9K3U3_9GLOM|nr:3749_t:CDS:1 [Cetraspora pellucida]